MHLSQNFSTFRSLLGVQSQHVVVYRTIRGLHHETSPSRQRQDHARGPKSVTVITSFECDPAYLMRLTLEQTFGDTGAQAIAEFYGTPVTLNGIGWIEATREASGNSTPPPVLARVQSLRRGFRR